MRHRVLGFLDALIQRPGAYHSTWQALREWGLPSIVTAAVWAFWTWAVQGIAAVHALGWGTWPVLGLILTAMTIGVVATAAWLKRYIWDDARRASSTASAPAPAVTVGAPDAWLQEAVFYIVHGRWLGEHEQALNQPGQLDKAADLLGEIRQLARNGELMIWGKIWENSTWDPIPTDYWAHHDVDAIELMRERPEHMRTSSATPEGKEGPFHKSLRVSKAQFEQRWPAVAA
jgi:hypothetical protein